MKDNNITKVEVTILILQIIKHNGNINYLECKGFSYAEIITLLRKLITEGYVESFIKRLKLTEKGENHIVSLNKKLKRSGLYKFVSPQLNKRINRIGIDEIYVPLKPIKE